MMSYYTELVMSPVQKHVNIGILTYDHLPAKSFYAATVKSDVVYGCIISRPSMVWCILSIDSTDIRSSRTIFSCIVTAFSITVTIEGEVSCPIRVFTEHPHVVY